MFSLGVREGVAISSSLYCVSTITVARSVARLGRSLPSLARHRSCYCCWWHAAVLLLLYVLIAVLLYCCMQRATESMPAIQNKVLAGVSLSFIGFRGFRRFWRPLRQSPAVARSVAQSIARRRSRASPSSVICWRPWATFVERPSQPARPLARPIVPSHDRSLNRSLPLAPSLNHRWSVHSPPLAVVRPSFSIGPSLARPPITGLLAAARRLSTVRSVARRRSSIDRRWSVRSLPPTVGRPFAHSLVQPSTGRSIAADRCRSAVRSIAPSDDRPRRSVVCWAALRRLRCTPPLGRSRRRSPTTDFVYNTATATALHSSIVH